MTYCVGMRLNKGLVFMSDTRTNAGLDNFSTSRKLFTWSVPGEKSITIMTAGNLATTQAMVSLLDERSRAVEDRDPGILNQSSMFQVARLVGATLKEVIAYSSPSGQTSNDQFSASVIVGGQIKGGQPTIFLVYPQGNFNEITEDTPFFQIGETKYGKPILDRVVAAETPLGDAVRCATMSIASTMRSNISVGPPIEISIYRRDEFRSSRHLTFEQDSRELIEMEESWSAGLRQALSALPRFEWESETN